MHDDVLCSKFHHQAAFAQNYSPHLDIQYCSHMGFLYEFVPLGFSSSLIFELGAWW